MSIIQPQDLPNLRKSARILALCMQMIAQEVKAGVSCGHLNQLAETFLRDHGAKPSFKGLYGYPYTLITEINDEVVHGLSPFDKIIPETCIISLDCGAVFEKMHSDMCILLTVGAVSPEVLKLKQKTEESLQAGIAAVKAGRTVGDIGFAIDKVLSEAKLGNVLDLGGHGIGYKPHAEPHIAHKGLPGKGAKLFENMSICLEPMVTLGSPKIKFALEKSPEGQYEVVKTQDGSWAAHVEHQLLVTKTGCEILTVVPVE